MPVPTTVERSTPRSRASRRTAGVAKTLPASAETPPREPVILPTTVPSSSVRAGGSSGSAAWGAGACFPLAPCEAARAGAEPAPESPTYDTSTFPTFRISPSWPFNVAMVPARGDGTSTSALSVSISARMSCSATVSPTFTRHLINSAS
jgi:hypothetical protein